MSGPKVVTFHNPFKHPVYDEKTGKKTGEVDAVSIKFKIPVHEDGSAYTYELGPGEEMQIQESLAYAVKIYAPHMAEGPAPKAGAPAAPKK